MSKDAKDRMLGSVLGLVLTIGAVVILQTINPKATEVSITPLPATDGIFYTNGSDLKSAPISEANTVNIPSGYGSLIYKCSSGPALLIWKYPKINFEGNDENYSGVTVVRKRCGETEGLSGIKSFKTSFETSGIYYCMGSCNETGTVCSGYMSEANSSSGILSSPFKNNLNSIRIVNDIQNDYHYGIIFHRNDDPTDASSCTKAFYSTDLKKEAECFNDVLYSSSATVYFSNGKDYKSSGTGIDFYSEPFGWATGAKAGKYSLSAETIKDYWAGESQNLNFIYTGIVRPDKYKQIYQTFQGRAGSIKVNGKYLVILWSNSACQVFFKDIVNLKSTTITASIGKIDKINVIPIK